jgi:hypothetical protein
MLADGIGRVSGATPAGKGLSTNRRVVRSRRAAEAGGAVLGTLMIASWKTSLGNRGSLAVFT